MRNQSVKNNKECGKSKGGGVGVTFKFKIFVPIGSGTYTVCPGSSDPT